MKRKIALMRPAGRSEEAARICREAGVEPVIAPAIEISGMDVDRKRLHGALKTADYCVFMSSTAVERAVGEAGVSTAMLTRQGLHVVAVGTGTMKSLLSNGVSPDLPRRHSSWGVVEWVGASAASGEVVAVLRSDSGSSVIRNGLEGKGLTVEEFPLYRIGLPADRSHLLAVVGEIIGGTQYILPFSSSMMARNFFMAASTAAGGLDLSAALSRCELWAIGDETAGEVGAHYSGRCNISTRTDYESMLREILSDSRLTQA